MSACLEYTCCCHFWLLLFCCCCCLTLSFFCQVMEQRCQLVGRTLAQLSLHLLMNLDTTLQQHMGSFLLSSIFSSSPVKWIIDILKLVKKSIFSKRYTSHPFHMSNLYHCICSKRWDRIHFNQIFLSFLKCNRILFVSSLWGFANYGFANAASIWRDKARDAFPPHRSCVSYLIFVTGTTGARGEKSVMWRIF